MKTPFLLLALLLSIAATNAQAIDEAFVIGQWKVKKATALKDAGKPETKELVAGFEKAVYNFNADHTFAFDSKSTANMMLQLEKMFNDRNKWVFDKKKKEIKVGKKGDGYSVATFIISTEKNKVIFLAEDANIELVMKKQ